MIHFNNPERLETALFLKENTMKKFWKKAQVCAECHFLQLICTSPGNLEKISRDLRNEQRDKIRKGNFKEVTWEGKCLFECYRKIWSEEMEGYRSPDGYNSINEKLQFEINEKPRKEFCFFWKYRPGMCYDAAKELQKRDYELNFARTDRRHAIIGLWIAAFALIANIVITIISSF